MNSDTLLKLSTLLVYDFAAAVNFVNFENETINDLISSFYSRNCLKSLEKLGMVIKGKIVYTEKIISNFIKKIIAQGQK